ncbi:MAG: vWA domain-containing protein [Gammaproteobacteria bacterium]
MGLSFVHSWALPFGLIALLPFFLSRQTPYRYSSLAMIPFDWISLLLSLAVRCIAAAVILATILGLASPYRPEQTVERIGKGAHIVMLLDRSASMNENFAGRYFGGRAKESKVAIAREMITEFVLRRKEDLFGMISFSTSPIHVLPLTQDKTAILAAIRATKSRGRGVTNIAPGLGMALDYFKDRPMTGSRVILLVSDGAARIDTETQTTLSQLFVRNRVMLYWIYLRNKHSASLKQPPPNPNETTTPEYFLHRFFQSMEIPYQAFEAEDPEALQRAIEEIEKLENNPIRYREKIPRQELAEAFYFSAAFGLLILLAVGLFEYGGNRRNTNLRSPG